MIRLLYTSKATYRTGKRADFNILEKAIQFNATVGITGYLVRTEERFFQVLEGPENAVMALLAKIQTDPRNSDLKILSQEAIDSRHFQDWSMGFKILTPKQAQLYDRIDDFNEDEIAQLTPRIYEVASGGAGVFQLG